MSGIRDRSDSSKVFKTTGVCTLQNLLVRPLAIGGEHRPFGMLVTWLAAIVMSFAQAPSMAKDFGTSGFGTGETASSQPCPIGPCCNAQVIPAPAGRSRRWDDLFIHLFIHPECVRIANGLANGPYSGSGISQKSLADFEGMPYFANKSVVGGRRIFPRQMDPKSSLGGIRTALVRRSWVQLGARYSPNLRQLS